MLSVLPCSPSWPGIFFVDLVDLELTELFLDIDRIF